MLSGLSDQGSYTSREWERLLENLVLISRALLCCSPTNMATSTYACRSETTNVGVYTHLVLERLSSMNDKYHVLTI